MTSQAQLAANRQNAQRSSGPITLAGKLIASRNATTHGLTANRVVIAAEDIDEFKYFESKMLSDLSPVGQIEIALSERIIALSWRIKRAEWMESAVLNVLSTNKRLTNRKSGPMDIPPKIAAMLLEIFTDDRAEDFKTAIDSILPVILAKKKEGLSPQTILGQIAIDDFKHSKILERILRYQSEMERSLYKAIFELQKIQYMRKRNESIEVESKTQKNETNPISKGGNPP